jgi:hypothetical protein
MAGWGMLKGVVPSLSSENDRLAARQGISFQERVDRKKHYKV